MPRYQRPHLGIFGRRNNGKSSLINALAGQEIAIVDNTAGTTTDPVKKVMELTGIGPVIIIDTAGIDDIGDLGKKRVEKSKRIIKQVDLAVLVITNNCFSDSEKNLIEEFKKFETPFFIIHNKSDIAALDNNLKSELETKYKTDVTEFSTLNFKSIDGLLELIKKHIPETAYQKPTILGDLVKYGDIVILVTPIDIEAPEGRLILPQVQTIRDILDNDSVAVVLKERELDIYLKSIAKKPALVVTDSQEFLKVDASVPKDIPMTSFSILFARLKGDFAAFLDGTPKISELQDGDKVLMLESCSHHVSCDDIGRVKIPRWISNFTGKKLTFTTVSGLDELPDDLDTYSLVIQCGGCVVTRKQLINRLSLVKGKSIPVTNYGMAISYVHGIWKRAVAPFTQTNDEEDYL